MEEPGPVAVVPPTAMPEPRWRVLAVVPRAPDDEAGRPAAFVAAGTIRDFAQRPCPGIEVRLVSDLDAGALREQLAAFQPNLVYLAGPCYFDSAKHSSFIGSLRLAGNPSVEETVALFREAKVSVMYLDGQAAPELGEALHQGGAMDVVSWADGAAINAVVAAHFCHAFLATLAAAAGTVNEAMAMATHSVQGLITTLQGGTYYQPPLPQLLSTTAVLLPDLNCVPPPVVPGLDPALPLAQTVPGWEDMRLLAPRAELHLLMAGGVPLVDGHKLAFLGHALRALLVMEARQLTLVSTTPCAQTPINMPPGCVAVRCELRLPRCADPGFAVVLGGQPSVLANPALVQHALRMTLVADALSLQFRLPPPGPGSVRVRSSAAVAGGTPVMDLVVLTSVWAVLVLRLMAQDAATSRSLVALGIAAVGITVTAGMSPVDVARLKLVSAGLTPRSHPFTSPGGTPAGQPAGEAAGAAGAAAAPGDGVWGASAASSGGAGPSRAAAPAAGDGEEDSANADVMVASTSGQHHHTHQLQHPPHQQPRFSGQLPGYTCGRPVITECTEEAFLEDLVRFLTLLRGRPIDRSRFPDAVLNGIPLDLYTLYREVVTRGGFKMGVYKRGVGSGINWKGQVFNKMRNWTETHRQTGVGNALKRHYHNYLVEYEMAHPEDVVKDRCALCMDGESEAMDWLTCDLCEGWTHFSCDTRPDLGAFTDYLQQGGVRTYVCPGCSDQKRQRITSGAAEATTAALTRGAAAPVVSLEDRMDWATAVVDDDAA